LTVGSQWVFHLNMRKIKKESVSRLRRKARRGFQGYPVATVALYGPTDELATKVAVGIVRNEGEETDLLQRWFSEDTDIRHDAGIEQEILAFILAQGAKSVAITDRIIGCPHEEGIDYPSGKSCPICKYWAGRDRWTHERIH
jgi:hypothetical protein